MTTELTLREKVREFIKDRAIGCCSPDDRDADDIISDIASLLAATGAPAYIRVADDLRGVVRELYTGEGEPFDPAEYLAAHVKSSGDL